MGQAKTRGSRDDRVQQALARRMDTANRRMEQQARLAERFELVKRVMDGDTSVQLPQGVLDRLKPLGLSVVGVGYDGTTQDVSPAGASFSPHAAADAYLTREQLAERLSASRPRCHRPERHPRPGGRRPRGAGRCTSRDAHGQVGTEKLPMIGIDPGQPGRRPHRVSGHPSLQLPVAGPGRRGPRGRGAPAGGGPAVKQVSARAPSPK
jgi:hypothetical protein